MEKDRIKYLLLPIGFMIILFIPVLFADIYPEELNSIIKNLPEVLRIIYVYTLMFCVILWCLLFYHIPTSVYIIIMIVYTGGCWAWLLKRKRGNKKFFVIWVCLVILSIILYWRLGPLYYSIINA